MSLFPAYALDLGDNITANDGAYVNKSSSEPNTTSLSIDRAVEEPCTELLALEAQLLASDNDEERDVSADGAPSSHSPPVQQDYYLDQKLDVGNLRVSTLYYPGRPQYETRAGGRARRWGAAERARRYYAAPAPAPDERADAELAQRTKAFRDMLAENPTDEVLWLQFIEFEERWRGADAALAAASAAAARLRGSARVRSALWRARGLALAPHARLDAVRQDLAAADGSGGGALTELWLRALALAGAGELAAGAGAALRAARAWPRAYPLVLYAYGAAQRAAGHAERLVLLLELVCSMNFPPAAFPPPPQPEQEQERERQLQLYEDKVLASGLPLSTVWVRVERARAAAHWRAPGEAGGAGEAGADPQRWPQPADVADLLRPVAGPEAAELLLVNALRLAKVPLLPCAEHVLRAADGANDWLGDEHEAIGELLPALLRAARRLPPAHPAHPARLPPAARARLVAMFVEPPHYFTDDAGYLSWVTALWDAACEWLTGERRVALLCWRLRWLHSLLLLLDPQEETGRKEAQRVRGEARAALKRFAGTSAQPFVHFARIEHAAGAPDAARRTALHALRAALRAPGAAHERLYAARALGELGAAPPAAWATACAALGAELPPDAQLSAPPPPELLARALAACEARCAAAERELRAEGAGAEQCALGAGLAGAAEWAAARARLAEPARVAELVAQLSGRGALQGAAARYDEQSAVALVLAGARAQKLAQYARALAPLFPHNVFLALACSGAPLWAWERGASLQARLRALGPARSHRAALAGVLPALLGAAAADWAPGAAARLERACARAGRGGAGGALLAALRLEAAARAARGRADAALWAALAAQARHKWLAVRGAALVPAQLPALADALLEQEMRAHALLDELAPPGR